MKKGPTVSESDEIAELSLVAIRDAIRSAAELLPSQGPITAFAFLNPLQGLENLPFDDALRLTARYYGCEPYLEESRYYAKLQRGRITFDDLREILAEDLGERADETIAGIVQRGELRLKMLQHPLYSGAERELRWVIAETDAVQRFRSDIAHEVRDHLLEETRHWVLRDLRQTDNTTDPRQSAEFSRVLQEAIDQSSLSSTVDWDEASWERLCLNLMWRFIHRGIRRIQSVPAGPEGSRRHRDLLVRACSEDADQMVHEVLVRYCAAFLDQGYADWILPDRSLGFFGAFCSLYGRRPVIAERWLRGLPGELLRIQELKLTPEECIAESLSLLGVPPREVESYLRDSLLALRGWSGMIWQTETRPDRVYLSSPAGTLTEFLAVRLILDRLALQSCATEFLRYSGPLCELRGYLTAGIKWRPAVTPDQQAFLVFQLAQIHGWLPRTLAEMSVPQWQALVDEINSFSSHERRRIYHAAFERQLAARALDAISVRTSRPPVRPQQPKLQIVCCIDAREESFRRHLEETAPDVETFGTAGFFGIPMYYRGAADAHFAALCPIVIRPGHWVVEDVVYSFEESHRARTRARRVLGAASHSLHVGTRGSLGGAFVSTLLGPLATAPLLSRILFPRLSGRMHRTARQFVAPPAVTRLRLERETGAMAGPDEDGIGFTLAEMTDLAERALRDIGLTSGFAGLVVFLGHGSSCLNNPHESAYHCGACSGSPGGPNARALAAMLNDLRVRRRLRERGLQIPEETWFIGGLHNTATEEITFFDLELLPTHHVRSLRQARDLFAKVAERNAHERCRRFESADLDLSPAEALRHVQDRTEDLAQTRPEYGNGTNALCFVGRRSRIRGLYLDRRSFLMSYDPTQDDVAASILARILGAVIPVCEGINLLYTLSAMDSPGWGSGTKLPHNVTSLLGVMDGAASDLRTGLPWQGVDIHEPVRLLFVVETSPDQMLRIMDQNATVGRICRNGWAQIAVLDPESTTLQCFRGGRFVPWKPVRHSLPAAGSSQEWYRGWRDHLEFAQIGDVGESRPRENPQVPDRR